MSIPRHWRLQNQRYQMVGEVCHKCGAKLFPPRDVCPECSKPAYEPFTFSGKGTVYSYSTDLPGARPATKSSCPTPWPWSSWTKGPMVTAQLTDVDRDEVEIGMPVEMVTRKMREEGEDGLIVYGYKFRRAVEKAA